MARRPKDLKVHGRATLHSPWFSNRWVLLSGDEPLAALERRPRARVSTVTFPDGTAWVLRPEGFGLVRALEGDVEVGRILRRSWWGRRWDVTSVTWSYELVSDPVPRRWHLSVGSQPVAWIRGSLVSYNRVEVDAQLGLPVAAIVLAWHVIARPWEAAARPTELIPVTTTPRAAPGPA